MFAIHGDGRLRTAKNEDESRQCEDNIDQGQKIIAAPPVGYDKGAKKTKKQPGQQNDIDIPDRAGKNVTLPPIKSAFPGKRHSDGIQGHLLPDFSLQGAQIRIVSQHVTVTMVKIDGQVE